MLAIFTAARFWKMGLPMVSEGFAAVRAVRKFGFVIFHILHIKVFLEHRFR